MSATGSGREKLWTAVSAFLVASGLFSWAVSGWLTHTDPALGQLIWPGDINRWFTLALGGSVERDALGQPWLALSVPSIWLRILVVAGLLVAIGWRREKKNGSKAAVTAVSGTLKRASWVLISAAGWWILWLLGDIGFITFQELAAAVLPLWVSVTAAVLTWIGGSLLLSAGDGSRTAARESRTPLVLLGGCIVGWAGISFWMNACLYDQLLIPHGDSAMYEEHLWNIWHGKGFRSYLDQGLFLGEHLQVIHLLLLPLHIIWPSHLMLELVESVALASCAIPIFLMTQRYTGSRRAAVMLGTAWLMYFPMHYLDISIDQKTFRPIALGVPCLFWLIELAERHRYRSAFLCLLLALSAKEDVALISFPLLAVLAFRAGKPAQTKGVESATPVVENRAAIRWFSGMAIFSAVYLIVAVLIVIPAFRSGDAVHYSRYFGDLGSSPGELVRTSFTQPMKVIGQILSVRTALYALVFLSPLAFFPIRRLFLLSAGSLTFLMLSLIQLGDGDLPPVPFHHFHAPLLPVLFWAAAAALSVRADVSTTSEWSMLRGLWKKVSDPLETANKTKKTGWSERVRHLFSQPVRGLGSVLGKLTPESKSALILLCCIFTSMTGSLMPCGFSFWSQESPFGLSRLYRPSDPIQIVRAAMIDRVLDQIPMTARVAATDFVHTRLTHRERSYDYSDYLRAVNDYQPGVPADTEFIVIDTSHRYSRIHSAADVPELRQYPTAWRLLPDTTNGHYLILQRRSQN